MKKLQMFLLPVLLFAQSDSDNLQRIFDEEHAEFLSEYPQMAT